MLKLVRHYQVKIIIVAHYQPLSLPGSDSCIIQVRARLLAPVSEGISVFQTMMAPDQNPGWRGGMPQHLPLLTTCYKGGENLRMKHQCYLITTALSVDLAAQVCNESHFTCNAVDRIPESIGQDRYDLYKGAGRSGIPSCIAFGGGYMAFL